MSPMSPMSPVYDNIPHAAPFEHRHGSDTMASDKQVVSEDYYSMHSSTPSDVTSPISPIQRNAHSTHGHQITGSLGSQKKPEDFDGQKETYHSAGQKEAYRNEDKQFAGFFPPPSSSDEISKHNEETGYTAKRRCVCGLRLCTFVALLILACLIAIAAILGGVLGSRAASKSAPSPVASPNTAPAVSPTTAASPANTFLPASDVIAGSPLAPVSYVVNAADGEGAVGNEAYRLFFQSVGGNPKELDNNGEASTWASAVPIFTDAINNTGLAAITYLNGSTHQTSLFYIGDNALIREKRMYPGDLEYDLGSLTYKHYPATALPFAWPNDTSNSFDSYRMAVVYSTEFATGPGARFFYHVSDGTGSSYVQELIWFQTNDSWAEGAQFSAAVSSSHIEVVIDDSTETLRLFYVANGPTLRESYIDYTRDDATYENGQSYTSLLQHHNSDFAVLSTNASTYLYYLSPTNATSPVLSIRELNLPIAGSSATVNPSSASIVATPALLSNDTQGTTVANYAPVAATALNNTITVFFTQSVADSLGGYGEIVSVSRGLEGSWAQSSYGEASGQSLLPLGSDDVKEQTS
ncbi:hypothetical protein MMC25_002346 [Agyrium rufum]|nr:hypothetical protein [Agyrium rufum]